MKKRKNTPFNERVVLCPDGSGATTIGELKKKGLWGKDVNYPIKSKGGIE